MNAITDAELLLRDNVTVRVHDLETLRAAIPGWDDLTRLEKLRAQRQVEPTREHTTHNVTTVDLHEYLVDNLHTEQAVNETASHLAVGDDATSPSAGDSTLTNEVYRTAVTDSVDRGTELFTSTFLDSSEANGYTLEEVGLVTADTAGTLLNHALINSEPKSSDNTATINVSLTFSNP